jgi:hypothetical protein
MITVARPVESLRPVVDAFRETGGDGTTLAFQAHLSWAEDDATAVAIAHDQWRTGTFGAELTWNLELPRQFDDAARFVRPEDVCGPVMVSADPGRHAAWIHELIGLGPDAIYLHHVGTEQDRFLDVFGDRVLPEVTS